MLIKLYFIKRTFSKTKTNCCHVFYSEIEKNKISLYMGKRKYLFFPFQAYDIQISKFGIELQNAS